MLMIKWESIWKTLKQAYLRTLSRRPLGKTLIVLLPTLVLLAQRLALRVHSKL